MALKIQACRLIPFSSKQHCCFSLFAFFPFYSIQRGDVNRCCQRNRNLWGNSDDQPWTCISLRQPGSLLKELFYSILGLSSPSFLKRLQWSLAILQFCAARTGEQLHDSKKPVESSDSKQILACLSWLTVVGVGKLLTIS